MRHYGSGMPQESWVPKLHRGFEIRDELRDYLVEQANAPRPARYETNADEHTNRRVWAQWVAETVPSYERAAVLLGDAIHNLRAAMDHAVWAITPEAVRLAYPRRVAFPLHSTEKLYKDWLKSRKSWYGPTVLAVFEWAQPYAASANEIHPLHILQYLSNTDKHQLLNVVANNQVNLAEITVEPKPEGGVVSSVNEGVVEPGTVLARVEFPRHEAKSPGERTSMDIKGVFAYEQVVRYVDISENERWLPVGEVMNRIGPMVVEAVGYVISADLKDRGLYTEPSATTDSVQSDSDSA